MPTWEQIQQAARRGGDDRFKEITPPNRAARVREFKSAAEAKAKQQPKDDSSGQPDP